MFGRSLSDDSDEQVTIDLSSMIDCIFILLIFFIVSTVFVEETGVTINKPDVSGASALEKNSILLAVTSEDKVFYGGESIGVQGVVGKIKPLLTETPDMPVIIQGDKDSSHGIVQQVHGQAMLAGAMKDRISVSTK
jgi:biopolymer transport protein ExbD